MESFQKFCIFVEKLEKLVGTLLEAPCSPRVAGLLVRVVMMKPIFDFIYAKRKSTHSYTASQI